MTTHWADIDLLSVSSLEVSVFKREQFTRAQVFADAAHINAMFKEIAAGTVEQHQKWNFTMVYQADDKLEYHLATVTEILPSDTKIEDFDFTVNTISAKLTLDGDVADKVATQRELQKRQALKARMVERAQELAEQEKYRKLAEQDDEMKKLYQQMYGDDQNNNQLMF